jgi:hypothetical protein
MWTCHRLCLVDVPTFHCGFSSNWLVICVLLNTNITLQRWSLCALITILSTLMDFWLMTQLIAHLFLTIFLYSAYIIFIVYMAELYTVYWAPLCISHQIWTHFLICSDWLSAINNLLVTIPDHPITSQVVCQLSHLTRQAVVLSSVGCQPCWYPWECHWRCCQRSSYGWSLFLWLGPLVTDVCTYLHHVIYAA